MKTSTPIAIYGGTSPTDVPTYTFAEASRYLGVPKSTVRAWFLGSTSQGNQTFEPVLSLADGEKRLLSFTNLVEVYVLYAIRRVHRVQLSAVRKALNFLAERWQSDHPLAHREMLTDGVQLFVEEYDGLVSVSENGQLAIKNVLNQCLRRIVRNEDGSPIKLYPITASQPNLSSDAVADAPRAVSITPIVQFGRPCIDNTGIPTEIIAARYKAGDGVDDLAADYGRTRAEIEEAVRYEMLSLAA